MTEFFNPWRRKIGVITLVMALVLMGGWLMCLGKWSLEHVRDKNSLQYRQESSEVCSLVCGETRWISWNESLIWTSRSNCESGERDFLYWEVQRPYGTPNCFFEFSEMEWQWESLGFGVGWFNEFNGSDVIPNSFWMAPYWSLVLPLTALSAFLLLTNPQKSNQKKITEPIQNEGGAS